ncbi:GNAT family N-acetyltransferase [Sulfitobacter sp. BDSS02]|nr:GNAT family N-acetyltransferase [Sulfitobacter sp. BDSS02]MBR9848139.1 GNAT family N-acetyltransferase [Paracoccaceae bacterium]
MLSYRNATIEDAEALNEALSNLSAELGDTHRASVTALCELGWGANPACRATLAETEDEVVGVALFSPYVSTVFGSAGIYVSDLWTAPSMRGKGVGKGLLAAALRDGKQVWNAKFMKLDVYNSNLDARQFYERLGFRPSDEQTKMMLDEAGCTALKGRE